MARVHYELQGVGESGNVVHVYAKGHGKIALMAAARAGLYEKAEERLDREELGLQALQAALRIDNQVDHTLASPAERLNGAIAGDPVADYVGFPEIQRRMIRDEAA